MLVLAPPKLGAGGDCATEPKDGGAAAVVEPKGLPDVAVLFALPNEGVDCAVEPKVGGAADVGGAKGLAAGAVLIALPNDGVDPKPPPVLPLPPNDGAAVLALLPKVGAALLPLPKVGAPLMLPVLPNVGAAVLATLPNEAAVAAAPPKLNPGVLDAVVAGLPKVVTLLAAGAPKLNGDFALLVEVGAAWAGAAADPKLAVAAVAPKLGVAAAVVAAPKLGGAAAEEPNVN